MPEGLAHMVKVVAELVRVNLEPLERGDRSPAARKEIDRASPHTRAAVRILLLAAEEKIPEPSAQVMATLAVVTGLEKPTGDDENKHHRRLESWRKIKQRAQAYLRRHEVTLQEERKAERRGFLDALRRQRSLRLGIFARPRSPPGTPESNSTPQVSPGIPSDENRR